MSSLQDDLTTLRKEHQYVSFCIQDFSDEDYLFLDSIEVNDGERNKGYGTAFMHDLCNLANKHELYIDLSPSKHNIDRLIEFYEKFDFIVKDEDFYMSREPECQPVNKPKM